MDPIRSKKQNYRLWQSGAFGNKLRAWRTIDEWRASGYTGTVAIRSLLGQGGGGLCAYDVYPRVAARVLYWWASRGYDTADTMINEMAPGETIILQGEYLNDVYTDAEGAPCWGTFLHSRVQRPMRDAFKQESATLHGLQADLQIRAAMTPSSYEDWKVLLDQYPGHVLEVSIFDQCLGDIPGRNALVWEVRRY